MKAGLLRYRSARRWCREQFGYADSLEDGSVPLLFYASDRDEPRHVHVQRDDRVAKFWLEPVRLQYSGGFSRLELNRIRGMIEEHRVQLVEAWNGYFG